MLSEMQLVFLILVVTTICFAIPRFRSDLVALCSLLALYLTGLLTLPEALAGFSNTVVIMLAALFIVGEGIFQTGLAGKAGNLLVKWTGNSEFKMMVFVMLLVAALGCFISNTGTVAILLPVVVSLCMQMNIHPGKLLMPLAFGASMGGTLTLIGTAPNLIARETLIAHGFEGLSFFDFTPVGLIILLIGITYMWFIGRKWLDKPQEKTPSASNTFNLDELLRQYQIEPNIHYIKIPKNHNIIGKKLKELKWPSKYDITVLEVLKKDEEASRFPFSPGTVSRQLTADPNYLLEEEDVLLVYADVASYNNFIKETGVEKIELTSSEQLELKGPNIAEVILTPQSRLINQSLKDVSFRDKYGMTVLSIKRQYQKPKLPSMSDELRYGDAMLVYGKWKDIDLLSKEKNDIVVLRHAPHPPEPANQSFRGIIAGVILLCMMIMLVFEWIPVVITVVIAALLMVLTGSVRSTDQAYRSVSWQIVVLIACMLPMATALEKTGGVAFIADNLTASLGAVGPLAVLAGLYAMTSIFGLFISNTATAVLFLPVAILTAQEMNVSPFPMVMAVTYAASMSFATPVSTPPNAMVMAAGKYTFFDFMKVGIPLQFIIGIIVILVLPIFFPF